MYGEPVIAIVDLMINAMQLGVTPKDRLTGENMNLCHRILTTLCLLKSESIAVILG